MCEPATAISQQYVNKSNIAVFNWPAKKYVAHYFSQGLVSNNKLGTIYCTLYHYLHNLLIAKHHNFSTENKKQKI